MSDLVSRSEDSSELALESMPRMSRVGIGTTQIYLREAVLVGPKDNTPVGVKVRASGRAWLSAVGCIRGVNLLLLIMREETYSGC